MHGFPFLIVHTKKVLEQYYSDNTGIQFGGPLVICFFLIVIPHFSWLTALISNDQV
jgi:hypothetical protein